jgi:hypothetical protein
MILKATIWIESNQFSNPEVEKKVLEDLLYQSLRQSLSFSKKNLQTHGDKTWESTVKFRDLTIHLKDLEAEIVSSKRVLEVMRTGLKGNNPVSS